MSSVQAISGTSFGGSTSAVSGISSSSHNIQREDNLFDDRFSNIATNGLFETSGSLASIGETSGSLAYLEEGAGSLASGGLFA